MPQIVPTDLEIIKRALTLQEGWDKALEVIAKLDEHKATPEEIARSTHASVKNAVRPVAYKAA